MKDEKEIKQMRSRLHRFINSTSDKVLSDDAWLMVSALTWVLDELRWSPLDILCDSAEGAASPKRWHHCRIQEQADD